MDRFNATIQLRRDSEEGWDDKNPILEVGEPGVILGGEKAGLVKIGNGIDRWRDLPNLINGIEPVPPAVPGGGKRGSTVIVGSSRGGLQNANQVDYLCNGTDDQVIINQAIAAAWPSGAEVLIRANYYRLSGPILLRNRGVKIRGESLATTFWPTNNAINAFEQAHPQINPNTGKEGFLTFENFSIEGASSGFSGNNINHALFKNIDIRNSQNGILFSNGSHNIVENCNFIVNNIGIAFSTFNQGTRNTIRNNKIKAATGIGGLADWCIVHNNVLEVSTIAINNVYSYAQISDCSIYLQSDVANGISVAGNNVDIRDVFFAGQSFPRPNLAINLNNSRQSSISNCRIKFMQFGIAGGAFSNISNNTFMEMENIPIDFGSQNNNCLIIGNRLLDSAITDIIRLNTGSSNHMVVGNRGGVINNGSNNIITASQ